MISKNSSSTCFTFWERSRLGIGSALLLAWTWIRFYSPSLCGKEPPTRTILKTAKPSRMSSTIEAFNVDPGRNLSLTEKWNPVIRSSWRRMRREEVAFGSVADLTFRFRHNKACTVFSHLGAQRAIGNDSTTVLQIRKLILSNRCCSLDSGGTTSLGLGNCCDSSWIAWILSSRVTFIVLEKLFRLNMIKPIKQRATIISSL